MAVTAQHQTRMSWDEDTKEALWEFVRSRASKGSLSKALKDFAETRGLSVHTTRAKYYQILKERESQDDAIGRGPGRNWSPEEDRKLAEMVREAEEYNRSINEVFEQAAQLFGRTPVAVRARYYRTASHGHEAHGGSDNLLDTISAFFVHAKSLEGFDVETFFKGLSELARLAQHGAESLGVSGSLEELEEENKRLREKILNLEQRMEKLRDQYITLDFLVNEFINLSSIEKVTSLGDFGRRLKYQVDQFGTVVKIERM
ncbi:MAG: SANT/Myb-like DNA-binding domain-containing protein [Bacillota bacterium]